MTLNGFIDYRDENDEPQQHVIAPKVVDDVEHAIAEMRSTGSFYCREGLLIKNDDDSYNFYPPSSIKTIIFEVKE